MDHFDQAAHLHDSRLLPAACCKNMRWSKARISALALVDDVDLLKTARYEKSSASSGVRISAIGCGRCSRKAAAARSRETAEEWDKKQVLEIAGR